MTDRQVEVPLLRLLVGQALRRRRLAQQRTLRDVSDAARVSMPYLSEVERGRKEASSEVLAAICRALGIRLADLLDEVREELARVEPQVTPSVVANGASSSPVALTGPTITAAANAAAAGRERVLAPRASVGFLGQPRSRPTAEIGTVGDVVVPVGMGLTGVAGTAVGPSGRMIGMIRRLTDADDHEAVDHTVSGGLFGGGRVVIAAGVPSRRRRGSRAWALSTTRARRGSMRAARHHRATACP
ncbi:helix-turn-helix transcriptional regulator [Frankia sp. AiPa1]|uniref:helix-turn-helix domain-containing protein n=1 Tax=Frankia sp. AiPa1 TaxID=573492 RepID=UPI00202B2701|nr:helix-turn-helix transcriptional regulator [Frankia sp. AiPa1]